MDCLLNTEPYPFEYGAHTLNCEIAPVAEIDSFDFDGTAGDELRIACSGTSLGASFRVQLLDPTGVEVASSFCTTSFCTFVISHTLASTGTYRILVTELNDDATGSYTLQLERIPPALTPPCIGYSATVCETISPLTDHDFLSFLGEANTQIRINVAGLSLGSSPYAEVYDPTGALVTSSFCTTSFCSFQINLTLALTGEYTILITELDRNATGNYTVRLDCIFGACPETACAMFRNCNGVNPACYTNLTQPVLGTAWNTEIDHSGYPGATSTLVGGNALPTMGTVFGFGEVLIAGPKLFRDLVPSSGTIDPHSSFIPNDVALAGVFVATQGAILGSSGIELCNAIDLVVGF